MTLFVNIDNFLKLIIIYIMIIIVAYWDTWYYRFVFL